MTRNLRNICHDVKVLPAVGSEVTLHVTQVASLTDLIRGRGTTKWTKKQVLRGGGELWRAILG
jgi:hypothetical protein